MNKRKLAFFIDLCASIALVNLKLHGNEHCYWAWIDFVVTDEVFSRDFVMG